MTDRIINNKTKFPAAEHFAVLVYSEGYVSYLYFPTRYDLDEWVKYNKYLKFSIFKSIPIPYDHIIKIHYDNKNGEAEQE